VEETHDLDAFRFRIRALVREELERIATGSRSAIDLSKVSEAEKVGELRDLLACLSQVARRDEWHVGGTLGHGYARRVTKIPR